MKGCVSMVDGRPVDVDIVGVGEGPRKAQTGFDFLKQVISLRLCFLTYKTGRIRH